MSDLTPATAAWAAHLARLDLTQDELATLAPQLASILDYVAQLQAVDTAGVEPLAHPLDIANAFRDDTPGASLTQDEALAGSPGRSGPYHSVSGGAAALIPPPGVPE